MTEGTSLQCRHRIRSRWCNLKTRDPSGYCHLHRNQPVEVDAAGGGEPLPLPSNSATFLETPRPHECPVCMGTLAKNVRALSCGHYVHRQCVVRSDTNQCPVCRQELADINIDRGGVTTTRRYFQVSNDSGMLVELPVEVVTEVMQRFVASQQLPDRPGIVEFVTEYTSTITSELPQNIQGNLATTLRQALMTILLVAIRDPSIMDDVDRVDR